MGAKLCTLCRLISDQNSKSPSARDGNSLRKENRGRVYKVVKRKMEMEMETKEKKVPQLTLEDFIRSSPDLKPDYIYACKQSKKKVHPSVSQFRGCLIAEAKDSLCLDRPMNPHEQMSRCSSIARSISGKSQKRVSFKLPHIVIFYSPDESCSPEEREPYYYSSENEGSFYSSICRENSFDSSAEEPFFRLAVDVLPHVFVSSKI